MIKLREYTKLFICVFFHIFVILSNGNNLFRKVGFRCWVSKNVIQNKYL